MEMPEIEREELLAQRAEDMQKFLDRQNLNNLVKAQGGGGDEGAAAAAKRQYLSKLMIFCKFG